MRKTRQYISLIGCAFLATGEAQRWNIVSTSVGTIPASEPVELSCLFENSWSAVTHPNDYPESAHWSPMVLASHSTDYEMWATNAVASPGVVSVAETGSTSTLLDELDAAGDAVADSATGRLIFVSNTPSTTIGPLDLDAGHSYLSTITMVAPSPDWFSGFYNFNVLDDATDTWYDSFVIETFPWDAGSDSGPTYESSNDSTDPQEPIFQLTVDTVPPSGVFLSPDGSTVLPMATWTCSVTSTASTPAPVGSTPAPVDATPAPVDSTPAPVNPTMAPIAPTLAPVIPTPSPVNPTPTPIDSTSMPMAPPTPASLVPPSSGPPSRPAPATIQTVQLTPKDFDGCMRVNTTDKSLLLATCVGPPEPRSQLFDLSGVNRIRPASNLNECLQSESSGIPPEGTPVVVADCDPSNAYQKFAFDATNGGSIRLAVVPEYCVVFSSDPPSLDSEPLILSRCGNASHLSNGWEVKS